MHHLCLQDTPPQAVSVLSHASPKSTIWWYKKSKIALTCLCFPHCLLDWLPVIILGFMVYWVYVNWTGQNRKHGAPHLNSSRAVLYLVDAPSTQRPLHALLQLDAIPYCFFLIGPWFTLGGKPALEPIASWGFTYCFFGAVREGIYNNTAKITFMNLSLNID